MGRLIMLAVAAQLMAANGPAAASTPGLPPAPLTAAAHVPGDCNGDGRISAPDTTTLGWEIMDGDGILAADTPMGMYAGNPGCDGNQDGIVDAGDLACVALLLFEGPGTCR